MTPAHTSPLSADSSLPRDEHPAPWVSHRDGVLPSPTTATAHPDRPGGALTAAQRQLAADHLNFAHWMAWQRWSAVPPWADVDGFISAAQYGLVKAARVFDPDRGVPFVSFAGIYIRHSLTDEQRDQHPDGRSRNGLRPMRLDLMHVEDTRLPLTSDTADVAVAAVVAGDVIDRLHADTTAGGVAGRRAALLLRHYVEDVEQQVLAGEMGVTPSRVSQLCREGCAALRPLFSEQDVA